ncbi:hypothetical protein BJX61DRAFT_546149 [Aspergillus egyptiacus]|nr:hypothetical protein BJX61DRAFT_546149 [Aspergillus egyptiacus]
MAATEYDYIIIGAGIGGLVLTSRLSEDRTQTVLLIEAGPDGRNDPRIQTPGLVTTLFDDEKVDWGFMTEPQAHVNGRQIPQPRGRVVGGSSALNFSMVMYPSRGDFDAWAKLGNPSWEAETMAPYLRRFHTYTAPGEEVKEMLGLDGYLDPARQGDSGPLPVSFPATYGDFNRAWDETFEGLGWTKTKDEDPIRGRRLGAFTCPLSVDAETATRGSAAAYPTDRPNVSLLTETVVERILFAADADADGQPAATGVQINSPDGQKLTLSARKEVILCAGSLHSPQLLELSGIGDADLLRRHDIPVVVDLPGVGENLQDHCISSISYRVADGQVSGDIMRDPQVVQSVLELYQQTRTGPLAGMPISVAYLPLVDGVQQASTDDCRQLLDAHAPTPTDMPPAQDDILRQMLRDGTEPAAEYLFLPLQLHANASGATSMAELFDKKAEGNYISILAILCHPFSRGSVHIRSPRVTDKPVLDPNYLSHPLDLEILARHTQYIDRVARSEPFRSLLQQPVEDHRIPDAKSSPGDLADLDVAKALVKDRLLSCFHPTGTCAMMPRAMGGVVDERLRVHGTRRLRVVDASVMPLEPSGNIQATVYALAERAADLIRGDAVTLVE